jgi:hypothetical protein
MYSTALKMYATVMTLTVTPRDKDEKGQGTLEYLGIVIIAALLVTAVVTAVKGVDIGTTVTNQIKKITDLGG